MTTDTKKPAIVIPPLPADLDPTKWHSRAEYRAWQDKRAAHYAALAAVRREADQEAIAARTPTMQSEAEYEAACIERNNAQRAKQAADEAERFAADQRKKEYLAASPEIADVLTNCAADMIREVIHWARRGYEFNEQGPQVMLPPSLWHVQMVAPAKKAKAAATETK